MTHNLYWSAYQNLEKELIELSKHIHIDDKQLEVYSMKIAELLIRTAVEFESLAKELYFSNGGTKPDDKELYFDTDCLALLKDKWNLDQKKVQVISSNFYFDEDKNKVLTPLRKAHKRGSSSEKWLKAYQAIKHNRRIKLEKNATLRNLICGMAGLFILNLYYKDSVIDLRNDITIFDYTCGSNLFSVFANLIDESNPENIYSFIFQEINMREEYQDQLDNLLKYHSELWTSRQTDDEIYNEEILNPYLNKRKNNAVSELIAKYRYHAILNK